MKSLAPPKIRINALSGRRPYYRCAALLNDLITLPLPHSQLLPDAREFNQLKKTVDRRPDRFNAWQKVQVQKRHLFALVGEEQIGKTWFAKIVMARCILAGWRVRYIDLGEATAILPLEILQRIANGDKSESPLTQPLEPTDSFKLFNRQLEVDRGEAEDKAASDRVKLDAYERIFRLFRDALANTAAIQPLVS